jgi:hypothetical protein
LALSLWFERIDTGRFHVGRRRIADLSKGPVQNTGVVMIGRIVGYIFVNLVAAVAGWCLGLAMRAANERLNQLMQRLLEDPKILQKITQRIADQKVGDICVRAKALMLALQGQNTAEFPDAAEAAADLAWAGTAVIDDCSTQVGWVLTGQRKLAEGSEDYSDPAHPANTPDNPLD